MKKERINNYDPPLFEGGKEKNGKYLRTYANTYIFIYFHILSIFIYSLFIRKIIFIYLN